MNGARRSKTLSLKILSSKTLSSKILFSKTSSSKTLSTNVALLRGINVGGCNVLPMSELAGMFVKAGCADVRTYIQSGNVIFRTDGGILQSLHERIAGEIAKRFGYRIPVVLRTAEELGGVIRSNPFLKAGVSEKALHVYFLAHAPDARNVASLDPHRSPPDQFQVRGREVYMLLPNGTARSKLTNSYFDSKLSTTSTARNWNTVLKLFDLMRADSA
jgi:uncharacterized protein (DUF1697 family)